MKIGSLFSGAGGLDLAVQAVFGGEVVWHAEIDKAASKVLAHRFPGVPNLGDITEVNWDNWKPMLEVDVLCGGFPCQDVSAAGKRAGIKDGTRSGLWAVFADAIDALRPQWVVIENVRGLLSATAHRDVESDDAAMGDRAGRPVLRAAGAVLGDLADLGYDAQWATVAAADVGAPHRRERVFIVATHTSQSERRGAEQQLLGSSVRRAAEHRECLGSAARCHGDAPDSPGDGWDEGRPEPTGIVGGFGVALLPTPTTQYGANNGGPSQFQRNTLPLNAEVTLLPTPTTSDSRGAKCGGAHDENVRVPRLAAAVEVDLPQEVQLLPTPRSQDANGYQQRPDADIGNNGRTVSLADRVTRLPMVGSDGHVELLPTPNAQDGNGGKAPRGGRDTHNTGTKRQVPLTDLSDLLPTPNASDSSGGGQHPDKRTGHSRQLIDYVLLCTPFASDGAGGKTSRSGGRIDEPLLGGQAREMATAWGKYEPAIRRWERIVGPAPAPTEPNKNGNPRLSALFSEWLMGWPAGWVTDPDIGISRNDQLRIVGNGVCPQQAVAALRFLLTLSEVAA